MAQTRPARWGLLLALVGLLGLVAWRVAQGQARTDAQPVAHINGEPIDPREFALAMLGERALVLNDLQRQGAVVDADFWLRRVAGTVPLEEVRRRALATLTRRKVEQLLAQQAGLVGDLRYETLLADLKRENARRREVLARGGVIYGPTQYDEAGYADYRQANLVQAHLRALAAQPQTSAELRAFYQTVKAQIYRRPDRVELLEVAASADGDAAERLEGARVALRAQSTPQEVARRYGLTLTRQALDERVARRWAMTRSRVLEAAERLPPRGISPVLRDGSRLLVVQVLSRVAGAVQPFEEVRGDVRFRRAEAGYRRRVDQEVRSARVEINSARLNTVGQDWWAP